MDRYIVGAYKLTATKLVSYPFDVLRPNRTPAQAENQKNLTRGEYNGYMSPKTKSKVSTMLNNWYATIYTARKKAKAKKESIPAYLTFVTLTLPAKQVHSDNEIKRKCLNLFITKLKEYKSVQHYFWRAESQGNGNIHFHLIVDRYLPMAWIQKHWNMATNVLGYIDRFQATWGHRQAPSTHIVKVNSLKDASKYVVNYLKKHEGRRIIKGRIWGCSTGLEELKSLCAIDCKEMSEFESYLANNKTIFKRVDSNYSVYVGDLMLHMKYKFKGLYNKLDKHYLSEYRRLYLADESPPIIVEYECNKQQEKVTFWEIESMYSNNLNSLLL